MAGSSDVQHDMLLLALDGELSTSPQLSAQATVLDVGTGTGTWACQIASRHPDSRVYGIDLHQVTPSSMPSNVVFETVNVMTGFPFNTGTFDLVHSRLLIGGITDWQSYLENLLRITKRGGYVECVELELRPAFHSSAAHNTADQWINDMAKMLESSKLLPDIAGSLEQKMIEAGFADVKDVVIETPIGSWPEESKQRKVGEMAMTFSEQHVIQWFSAALIDSGKSASVVSETASKVMEELSASHSQAYFRWHFVTGKKKD